MLFRLIVSFLLAVMVSLQVMILMMAWKTGEEPTAPVREEKTKNPEAEMAERKFSEGVLNVLNYENPMERGKLE